MKRILLVGLGGMLVVSLVGCTVGIGHYEARGIVEPMQPTPAVGIAELAFPWAVVADFLGQVLPTVGQTRRKAIEEKVKYTEERRFRLFSVSSPDKDKVKRTRRKGPYTIEFLDKERVRK